MFRIAPIECPVGRASSAIYGGHDRHTMGSPELPMPMLLCSTPHSFQQMRTHPAKNVHVSADGAARLPASYKSSPLSAIGFPHSSDCGEFIPGVTGLASRSLAVAPGNVAGKAARRGCLVCFNFLFCRVEGFLQIDASSDFDAEHILMCNSYVATKGIVWKLTTSHQSPNFHRAALPANLEFSRSEEWASLVFCIHN